MSENRNEKGQFVPGNQASKGNGRPKNALSIKNALSRLADELPEELEGEENDKTRSQLLGELAWKKALAGDRWFIQYVTEHKEGKPHQSQSIGIENDPDELVEIE